MDFSKTEISFERWCRNGISNYKERWNSQTSI